MSVNHKSVIWFQLNLIIQMAEKVHLQMSKKITLENCVLSAISPAFPIIEDIASDLPKKAMLSPLKP